MSKWNFKVLALALLLCCLFCSPAAADTAGYTITDYTVDAILHEDDTVSVQEHIEVEFTEESHGIYRSMPTWFYLGQAAFGGDEPLRYETDIRNIEVEGEPFAVEEENGRTRIRIGDAKTLLTGEKSYDISYTYVIPEDRLDEFDFLYYSVLGAEWDAPIDRFSFVLYLDKPLPDASVQSFQLASGRYGAEGNALNVVYTVSADAITGEAADIGPGKAITLFTTMPEGYFSGAKRVSPALVILSVILFLGTVLAAVVRMLTGNERKPVRTVQFYPPEGMSSAEVGVVMDEEVNENDMLSLIPLWAQQGYLTIEAQSKKTVILHKVKNLPTRAPKYQRTFFQALFGKKDMCSLRDLDTTFAKKYQKSVKELGEVFTGERELSTGRNVAYAMVVASGLFYALILAFNSRRAFADDLPLGIAAGFFLVFWGLLRVSFRGKLSRLKAKIRFALLSALILAVPAVIVLVSCGRAYDYFLPAPIPAVLLGLEILVIGFSGFLMKDTPYKVEMHGKLEGLKEFIRVAELPRLKLLMEQNPGYYYDILPYAMAFGLADKWAKQFEPLSLSAPLWYTGYADERDMGFLPYRFQHDLERRVLKPMHEANVRAAHEISAGEASSAASSSSGGFSSGGGGGGGGGGRW